MARTLDASLFAALFTVLGCAGSQTLRVHTPDWFGQECDDGWLCGEGTSDLPDLQVAKDSAENIARSDLAAKVEALASGLGKNWAEGLERKTRGAESRSVIVQHAEHVRTTLVAQSLRGIRRDRFEQGDDGRVYVRLAVSAQSVEETARLLSAREEAAIRQRAGQGYEELEEAVKQRRTPEER